MDRSRPVAIAVVTWVVGDQEAAGEDVVDQLPAAAEDPGEPLRLGDPQREIPHPLGISPVGAVEAGRADLRA